MVDPRVETVARILVDYSVKVKPNQLVRIAGAPEGAPLILAVYQKVLERVLTPFSSLNWMRQESFSIGTPAMPSLITFPRLGRTSSNRLMQPSGSGQT